YNLPENGLDGSRGNAAPLIQLPSDQQRKRLDELSREIAELEKKVKEPKADIKAVQVSLDKLRKEKTDLEGQIPKALGMQEMPKPRDTFMLVRGQYDKKGEKVTAGLPEFLDHGDKPRGSMNRLDLAKWLVSAKNPLTARVIVNRYWQMFF